MKVSGGNGRNSLQFSIRSLLMLMVLVCCWLAYLRHRYHGQEKALGKLIESEVITEFYFTEELSDDRKGFITNTSEKTWFENALGFYVRPIVVIKVLHPKHLPPETVEQLPYLEEIWIPDSYVEIEHLSSHYSKLKQMDRIRLIELHLEHWVLNPENTP